MIADVFIKRPRLAIVVSIVITIAGALSAFMLPIEQFPNITPPQVSVSATYPGANAEVIESSVAQQIESAVNGVEDMLYMSSTSSDDGSYNLTVTFNVGTDPDTAAMNVQNRVKRFIKVDAAVLHEETAELFKRTHAVDRMNAPLQHGKNLLEATCKRGDVRHESIP